MAARTISDSESESESEGGGGEEGRRVKGVRARRWEVKPGIVGDVGWS